MSWENKERRTFSDELKRNAVQRAEAGAHPLTQISRELGIHPSLLQVWRQSGPVESQENGKRSLRKALYFPAVVASRHNRALRQFAERLRSRDKSNMLIIVAVMRKLLTLAYGVLKSGMALRKDVLPA